MLQFIDSIQLSYQDIVHFIDFEELSYVLLQFMLLAVLLHLTQGPREGGRSNMAEISHFIDSIQFSRLRPRTSQISKAFLINCLLKNGKAQPVGRAFSLLSLYPVYQAERGSPARGKSRVQWKLC